MGENRSLISLMAITNNPPPQAYTREVLAQAYNWLKTQPASVRERAQSADTLVSLYLHAKRYGAHSLSPWDGEPEGNSQTFKSDLKNLARDFKDFEPPAVSLAVPVESMPTTTTTQAVAQQAVATTQTVQTVTTTQVKATSTAFANLEQNLDPRTVEILRDMRDRLNLSSEMEVLRMLIVIGYDRLRSILPPV